jgi:hypothetical protein
MPSDDGALTRLAETQSHVPAFTGNLDAVVRRARVRRARRLATAALGVAGLAAGLVVPIAVLWGLAPAETGPGSGDSPANPIRVPDHGFLQSEPYDGEPYVDHVLPEDDYLVTEKTVIGYGQVRGIPWSMAAYLTRAPGITNPGPADPPVACADLFLSGGASVCATSGRSVDGSPIPDDPDVVMYVAGPGYSYDLRHDELPEVVSFMGAIAEDVASVKVRTEDGRVGQAIILDAPDEIGWNFFVVLPPPFVDVTITARDGAGGILDRQRVDGCPGSPGFPPYFENASFPDLC